MRTWLRKQWAIWRGERVFRVHYDPHPPHYVGGVYSYRLDKRQADACADIFKGKVHYDPY